MQTEIEIMIAIYAGYLLSQKESKPTDDTLIDELREVYKEALVKIRQLAPTVKAGALFS